MASPVKNQSSSSTTVPVTAPTIRPLNEFDFSKPKAWPTWKKRFEMYMSVNLTRKLEKEKIDLLCYIMGESLKKF